MSEIIGVQETRSEVDMLSEQKNIAEISEKTRQMALEVYNVDPKTFDEMAKLPKGMGQYLASAVRFFAGVE